MRRWLLGVLFAVGFALTAQACGGVGCGADQQPIPGTPDAGGISFVDAAAGAHDAGPTATDASVPPMDAGFGDAGPGDAGPGDAGPTDAGAVDGGTIDAAVSRLGTGRAPSP